jgi:hypothetical protein
MTDKNISQNFDSGGVTRTPAEIAADPTLSNARKIELLKAMKDHHAAPSDKGVLRDADLEMDKLLKLNSLGDQH